VIVRIMTEDQYRLADEHRAEVDRLDDALEAAVDRGDAQLFQTTLRELYAYVHQHGTAVPLDEVVPSDLIIPDDSMSLDEARASLQAEEDAKASAGGE
jgi:hypothetical protein